MKLFESRNVLDRIETTWSMFFSSEWKVRVLPQILFTALGTTLGILSFWLLLFLVPGVMEWNTFSSPDQLFFISKALLILLIPITIFTLTSGITYTYTLSVSHDYEAWKTWQYYLNLALPRLWWWAWYGLWFGLSIIALIGVTTLFYFTTPLIFILSIVLFIPLFFWAIIASYAGSPGYILGGTWGIREFLQIFSVSSGRWWNIFGNMLLWSFVVSSVLSLVQQFVYWIMGIDSFGSKLAGLNQDSLNTWMPLLNDIVSDIGVRFLFGAVLLFIISGGQQVFIGMFQYTVWRETQTDADEEWQKQVE